MKRRLNASVKSIDSGQLALSEQAEWGPISLNYQYARNLLTQLIEEAIRPK